SEVGGDDGGDVGRAAAQAELDGALPPTALTEADVYVMIDYLGDLGHALNQTRPGWKSCTRRYGWT
ncbi:MAG: hypothetical protein ACRDTC_10940, partial [Pseudonocardiaceae bacterium]